MTAWLDRVAADLLHVEQLLRTTLRSLSRGGEPVRVFAHDRLWITPAEARALLRGAMPAPIAVSRMRGPHARLLGAMSIFAGHLVALNDPLEARRPDAAITAACQLLEELRRWAYVARWSSACRSAGVRLRAPRMPIIPVMGLQTHSEREHLPNAAAGQLAADLGVGGHQRSLPHQVRAMRMEQAELDLVVSSNVVDLRQLRLELAQPGDEERGHAVG